MENGTAALEERLKELRRPFRCGAVFFCSATNWSGYSKWLMKIFLLKGGLIYPVYV